MLDVESTKILFEILKNFSSETIYKHKLCLGTLKQRFKNILRFNGTVLFIFRTKHNFN